jgi:hypothetical protein
MRNGLIAIIAALLIVGMPACMIHLPQPQSPSAPASPPTVRFFKADPSRIENGDVVKLQWDVLYADSIFIDNGVGAVPSRGSLEVTPYQATAFNLTATNADGSVASAVMVNVRPFIKVSSPVSSPSSAASLGPNGLPRLGSGEAYVFFKGAVMVGADDHFVVLRNNPAAHNPTWEELKLFLQNDRTDRCAYVPGKYTCGDFAETLHNNAEAAGIRAAILAIELKPPGLAQGVINHSLNAFQTTDRGIIYIDDTSSSQGFYADKEAHVIEGDDYVCVSIVSQPGQLQTWPSMGKVVAIDIFQW